MQTISFTDDNSQLYEFVDLKHAGNWHMSDQSVQIPAETRVPYIDDDPRYGELVRQMLATIGCTVGLAEQGTGGLAAVESAS